MEITAKAHEIDTDMIVIMSKDQKYLIGVVNIDCFLGDSMYSRLDKGEELILELEVQDQ